MNRKTTTRKMTRKNRAKMNNQNIEELAKRVIQQFVGARFFIIRFNGEIDNLNSSGKSHRWAFRSAKQATNVAKRQGSNVFDKKLNSFIDITAI